MKEHLPSSERDRKFAKVVKSPQIETYQYKKQKEEKKDETKN
jgi:hypothetical protein